MDPKDKAALVTGGAQGLGQAISIELLKQGAKCVAVCDVNETEGHNIVQQMQQEFGKEKAIFIKTDVTKEDEMKEAFKEAEKRFGGLDIVVNNAGVCDDNNWRRSVEININGVIQGTVLALEHMGKDKGGKGGVVVNMASISGLGGGIDITPVYNATKQAIIGISCSFGSEFFWNTTGVRVIAICPGYTSTQITSGVQSGKFVTLREEWMDEFTKGIEKHNPPQKAENVGKGVLQMIREAPNGSLWICVSDKPIYQIKIPAYQTLRV